MNNSLFLSIVWFCTSTLFAAPEFPSCPAALLAPPPVLTDAQQKAAQAKSDAQPAPVVAVTCRLKKFMPKKKSASISPFGKLFQRKTAEERIMEQMAQASDYVALANSCGTPEQQQAACDRYADTPGFGPAAPIACTQFKTMGELKNFIKTKRFGGLGGQVVMCKTRLDGVEYAQPVPMCCLEEAQNACETTQNIADPISCHSFTDNVTLMNFLNDHGMYNGMECILKTGGRAYRTLVPSCSYPVVNAFCNPTYATLKTCSFLGKDPKQIADWTKNFINTSMVTCKINKTHETFRQPVADCSEETKEAACSLSSKPVGCKTYKSLTDLAKSFAKIKGAL